MQKKIIVTLGIPVAALLAASIVFAKEGSTAAKKSSTATAAAAEENGSPYYRGEGRRGAGRRGDGYRGEGYRRGGSGMHRGMLPPFIELTAQQQAAADKIAERSRKAAEPVLKEVQGLRTQMHEEWKAKKPNKQKLLSLNRQVRSLKGKLSERRISDRIEMIALLTPEQRQEMIERMPEKPHRDGRGRQDGRGRGKGRGFRDGRGPGGPDCAWNEDVHGRGFRKGRDERPAAVRD